MLRCVAVCNNVLQCVVLRLGSIDGLQNAVYCSALQCVAVRCSALQCVAVRLGFFDEYGVTTKNRLLKITGLFYRISSLL